MTLLFDDGTPGPSFSTGLSCLEGAPNGEGGDLNGEGPFSAKALFSNDGTPKPTCLPVAGVLGGDLNGDAAFFPNVLLFEDGTPNPGFFEDGTPNPTCLSGGPCLVDDMDGAPSFFESDLIVDVVSITSLVLTSILYGDSGFGGAIDEINSGSITFSLSSSAASDSPSF